MKSNTQRISILASVMGLVLAALLQPTSVQAAQGSHSKKATASAKDFIDPVSEGHASASHAPAAVVETHSMSRSETRYGLGIASAYNMTGSDAALTGWIGLSPKFGIQPLLSIGSTSPFNFAVGALGKYTVAQHGAGGFHLGGGAAVGSTHTGSGSGGLLFASGGSGSSSGFHMSLSALAGIHYEMPNTNIMFHFDGGANFGLVDGNTDFNLGAIGGLLGASVIYLF